MRKIVCWLATASLVLSSCTEGGADAAFCVIPMPNSLTAASGSYVLPGETAVSLPEEENAQKVFRYLEDALRNTPVDLKTVPQGTEADIRLATDSTLANEAYRLEVDGQGVRIASNATGAGWFYGVQSLLQLLPPDIYDSSKPFAEALEIPAVHIEDAPRFPHRGAMMDVGRNFLPKEEVLKFIDLMASYKMNVFHFHLTDDQGWRIEIKKYPRLTEVGSHRPRTQIGHSDYYYPRRYDNKEQRGYYTQDEIREIVRYAADRFITVVPEIEMPGHASAALASYPELSCGLGKTYVVRDYFDVFDEVYCPKEHTFRFLEDVLTEVMDLFPSHYIHIGGDECPKKAWKKCAHCQALMKREGLPDEEALQSWFIHRIEQFVNSRGRDIIGWDEILQGGLAPNATVMSWRGEEGGIEAARQKHRVIMTPNKQCYINYYQESPEYAPLAIGGYLPLDSVYAYDPLPAALSPEEQKYIIGTQANVWGEYIQTPETFEYMAFPRLLAQAEVQWTQPAQKDFPSFTRRLDKEFRRLDLRHVNACRNFYEVNFSGAWNAAQEAYEVSLRTFCPDAEIHYALNDSAITTSSPRYEGPIRLEQNAMVYAAVFRDGKPLGKVTRKGFTVNKATGRPYTCVPEAGWEHLNKGFGLADGVRGYARDMRRWISFYQDTVHITINLGKPCPVKEVSFASLWRPWNEIWPARAMSVSVSTDGKEFVRVGSKELHHDFTLTEGTRFPASLTFPETEATYVRLELLSGGPCPKGWFHEGNPSELALDEIEIY